jgi:hypothetical protein
MRDITDLDTPLGRQALAIHEQSFPKVERDPLENIAELKRSGTGDDSFSRRFSPAARFNPLNFEPDPSEIRTADECRLQRNSCYQIWMGH